VEHDGGLGNAGQRDQLRIQRDEAVLDGEADEAGGVVGLQFGHEVAAVLLDGLLAEWRWVAISRFVWPSAMSWRTSRSRR